MLSSLTCLYSSHNSPLSFQLFLKHVSMLATETLLLDNTSAHSGLSPDIYLAQHFVFFIIEKMAPNKICLIIMLTVITNKSPNFSGLT